MILREMTDGLILDLVDQGLLTSQIVLTVGYDKDNPESGYAGETQTDFYGRKLPKAAHGSANLGCHTSSTRRIMEATMELYARIVDRRLPVRRMYVVAANVMRSEDVKEPEAEQLDLFTDYAQEHRRQEEERAVLARERNRQQAMLAIKKKYGKNAILHGTSYLEGATGRDRNRQIGGHRA